ncbi:hypothetical protein OE88DRAFT_1660507 [Heliocybe sulcata]|uniref:Uncharacterized protein n=1 Tax=Heliocybe sulcata TaxID=5364 RepID=A0A5C3N095_9AGAM|nr:hypothetical protein OE88DRAFT_1660507 [Heliocybe sulcata]
MVFGLSATRAQFEWISYYEIEFLERGASCLSHSAHRLQPPSIAQCQGYHLNDSG